MHKTKLKAGLAGVLATTMSMAMMVTPAFAAAGGAEGSGHDYTPIAGTSTTFNKYFIMDAGDTVPNATFSFTVAPGAAVSADTSDNSVFQVLPGVGTPTIADVTFGPADATATAAGTNIDVARTAVQRGQATAADSVQLDAGEKYATKQATVSFSGITFPEPGVYRYIITETANAAHAAAGIIHDTDIDRVLDVYVTDDGTGTLVVSGYVMHTDINAAATPAINPSMGTADVQEALAALSDKTDGFTNEYLSKDLTFEKAVSGNQASRDKYFEFTVTASNIADEDVFAVSLNDDNNANTTDGANADATSGTNAATRATNQGQSNPATVTGAQLKAGQKFYLQHGQKIAIRGFAPNVTYTVTEDAEDYSSAVMAGKTNTGVIGTVAGENKVAQAGFTNTRNGVVPTGIAVAAGAGIAAIGAGAVGLFLASKKRKEDEE